MIDVQLYIENNRIDLFDDETISLTSSIQNVRDIAKIFSDYSQTFNVPANDRNNKIFKHFYNFDIDGFNATTKKRARIELNHAPFREGFIYVEASNLKNNVANTYTIVFYGGLVLLKDKIKDHTLQSLGAELEQYDHTYSAANVKTGFTTGLSNGDIIYPLITPEKRLYFDSVSSNSNTNYTGNLFSASNPDTYRGLSYLDLKPAIKVIKLIKAIETKYSIDFTSFFETDNTKVVPELSNLYLWLSRDSGRIIDYNSEGIETVQFSGFSSSNEKEKLTIVNDVWSFKTEVPNTVAGGTAGISSYLYSSEITISNITPSTRSVTIKAIDQITGDTIGEKVVTGSDPIPTVKFYIHSKRQNSEKKAAEARDYKIIWVAESDGNVTFQLSLKLKRRVYGLELFGAGVTSSDYTVFNNGTGTTLLNMKTASQLPDMKILDFLTGLFKMFNLTAYVNEPIPLDSNGNYNPVIDIKTLDDYYSDARTNISKGTIDLSGSIDVESHSVQAARPFTKVSFEYEETKTVLMEQHRATHNRVFGNTSYPKGDAFDFIGEEYKVELPFSHLKYERLYDSGAAGSDTEIQWGYAAGGTFSHSNGTTESNNIPTGNYSPEDIEPLLFYGINQTISNTSKKINWISGTAVGLSQYWRPSNSNEAGGGTASTAPAFNLNFDSEFDEWNRIDTLDSYIDSSGNEIVSDNSLFATYYSTYITSIYEAKKRIFKYNAYLPAKVLTTYKLNDQIKIHDNLFHINTMNTNITTGQTNLELINIVPNFSPEIPTSFEEPSLPLTPVTLGFGWGFHTLANGVKFACSDYNNIPFEYQMSSSTDSTTFANAEFLYIDKSGTFASNGFYSNGTIVRYFIDGKPNSLYPTTNCS